DMVLSWIKNNPFGIGIHWTSGLEVAMRAISWIWMLANLKEFSGLSESDRQAIVRSLGQHAYYLENHFSFYSSPYNHVIGEAAGLFLISRALEEAKDSSRWLRRATDVLNEFAPRQFFRDGFCVEQAMGYHYFTSGFLLLAELANRNLSASRLNIRELIVRSLTAGVAFCQPDRTWPAIGDVDSAQSIPVARSNYWDFSSTQQLAAVLLGEPEIACPLPSKSDADINYQVGGELYWLLGCDGLTHRKQFTVNRSPVAVTFPDAGYFVGGNESDQVIFDAGCVSDGLFRDSTPSAAHGHADTLQVLYQFDRQAVLVDSGMPNYAGDPKRAFHYRSQEAHNTLRIEKADLVKSRGVLDWSNEVQTPTLRTSSDTDRWTACGELVWPSCRVLRHVIAIPGHGLWVADWISSEQQRTATWFWQMPLGTLKESNRSRSMLRFSGPSVNLQVVGSGSFLTSEISHGDDNHQMGWTSPGYGIVNQGTHCRYSAVVEDTLAVMTHIGRDDLCVEFDMGHDRLNIREQPNGGDVEIVDGLGMGNWHIRQPSS
ncbi:MAG: heparinase II/III family protein, partial [Planctomycetales bacterium]|nr:heparinase II/III family protein [Planctomycetales bacterium]